jgi:hypothetical protein
MTNLQQEAQRLRRLVSSDSFEEATRCARQYTTLLEQDLHRLPTEQRETQLREAVALLQWAHRSMCAARASLMAQLRSAQRLAAYQPARPADATTHSWRIEA